MYVAVTRAKKILSIYNNIQSEVNTWLHKAIETGAVVTNTTAIKKSTTLQNEQQSHRHASNIKNWFQTLKTSDQPNQQVFNVLGDAIESQDLII